MSYSIEYEPEAIASLENLSAANRKRIITKINWLAGKFEQIKPQPLIADLSGFYKLRIGYYRVIYEFNTEESILFIDKVGHRSEIYDE
jgi:mRNA interferase RelE/StbE